LGIQRAVEVIFLSICVGVIFLKCIIFGLLFTLYFFFSATAPGRSDENPLVIREQAKITENCFILEN